MVRHDKEIEALAEEFVCVRLTRLDGLDLNLFQFDYDLTWAAVLMNADGTVYGRYGSRDGALEEDALISPASLKHAMSAALALHREYPANRGALAGKQPKPARWQTVDAIPTEKTKAQQQCFHCHHVYERERRAGFESKERLAERAFYPHPLPRLLGFELDAERTERVTTVAPGSAAERAGLRPGDRVRRFDGQPVFSLADYQWVLHHAPDEGSVPLEVEREGGTQTVALPLEGAWYRTPISWRESMWNLRPGMSLRDLDEAGRKKRGLAADTLALEVRQVFAPPAKGQFQKGDLIVALDGSRERLDEGAFLVRLRTSHDLGESAALQVLRTGGEEVAVELPVR